MCETCHWSELSDTGEATWCHTIMGKPEAPCDFWEPRATRRNPETGEEWGPVKEPPRITFWDETE